MADEKLNSKEIKQWDSLDTPQIANAEEGEEERTNKERLAAVKKNIDRLTQDIQNEAERARDALDDVNDTVRIKM